jgi:hypothetical protein
VTQDVAVGLVTLRQCPDEGDVGSPGVGSAVAPTADGMCAFKLGEAVDVHLDMITREACGPTMWAGVRAGKP